MTHLLQVADAAGISRGGKSKWAAAYMIMLLFVFSTAFSFAVGIDQRNYLLIAIMGVSCLLFFFTFTQFNSREIYVYGFYLSLVLCLIKYPETTRLSTLGYTLMFLITFIVYLRMLHRRALPFRSYLKILKFILYAYFWVLLIQQFCVLAKLPIVNFILGDSSELKLNALSPEPSHSARIITILFYSFICMRERELRRAYLPFKDGLTDLGAWFCFLYTMLTMGSATSYFLLALLTIRFVSIPTLFWGVGAALLAVIVYPFLDLDIIPLNRALTFGKALLSRAPYQLVLVDHSASIRVLPIYYYLEQVRLFSIDFWFGAGFDYNNKLFPVLIPGIKVANSVGGIFPVLFLNHGMVAGLLLLVIAYLNCLPRLWNFSTLLGTVLIFACGINTQLTWLVLILLATNRFFEQSMAEYSRR